MHDLFGTKDIQDAATETHSWMAGAVGHETLGAAPTLFVCWFFATGTTDYLITGGAVFAFFFLKEWWDYRNTAARQGSTFQFNADEVAWNAFTALFFITLGIVSVLFMFLSGDVWWRLVVYVALALAAARIAFWWLKRKLVFQQAGLPYQYRLATFTGDLDKASANNIRELANASSRGTPWWRFLFCADRPHTGHPRERHLVVSGPLNSGKTSLAVGIGTESAFSLHIGRYVSAVKLLQLLEEQVLDHTQTEYADGRILWPLHSSELLIIDDVAQPPEAAGGAATNYVDPNQYQGVVGDRLRWLGERRSVWVVGDQRRIEEWKVAVSVIIGVPTDQIMTVVLRGPLPIAPNFQSRVNKFDRNMEPRNKKRTQ